MTRGSANEFVEHAMNQLSDPYVYGAAGPGSFDCSGLVYWCCHQVGINNIPRSSMAQSAHCKRIGLDRAGGIRGALLFHEGHVAISLGNQHFVGAQNSTDDIVTAPIAGYGFGWGGLIPGMNYGPDNSDVHDDEEDAHGTIGPTGADEEEIESVEFQAVDPVDLIDRRDALWYLNPWGVTPGQKWTGLTTRATGSWDPVLTGFVQGLLSVMFEGGGAQWSIRKDRGRKPVLYLRRIPKPNDPNILEIDCMSPGVDISGARDFTQSANVVYGYGSDKAGSQFSGITISPNGTSTSYKPYSASHSVYPRKRNPFFNKNVQIKETRMQFQTGMDETAAMQVAQAQLYRFADPGITGSITLNTDLRDSEGNPFPRMLLTAGKTIRVKNLFGNPDGVTVHATQVSLNFDSLTATITYDSKYRDQLTVSEVQARTRDALTPLRSLQVGKYSNTVQDLVFPWSYRDGSGCIPSGGGLDSRRFFTEKVEAGHTFPYENMTRKFPPKEPSSKSFYIRIGPVDRQNSNNNWSGAPRNGNELNAIPIKASQAGSIRLSQIAAYDRNGNVMKVKFHASIYGNNGVTYQDMPRIPLAGYKPAQPEVEAVEADPDADPPVEAVEHKDAVPEHPADEVIKWLHPPGGDNYKAGQSNPFFQNGWETIRADGTGHSSDEYVTAGDADMKVGWGNYYEPAGYWPGRASRGSGPTGLMVDETPWSFADEFHIDTQDQAANYSNEDVGMLYIMIYCDDQGDEPVYFMGRLFRQEPGA